MTIYLNPHQCINCGRYKIRTAERCEACYKYWHRNKKQERPPISSRQAYQQWLTDICLNCPLPECIINSQGKCPLITAKKKEMITLTTSY